MQQSFNRCSGTIDTSWGKQEKHQKQQQKNVISNWNNRKDLAGGNVITHLDFGQDTRANTLHIVELLTI